MKFKMPNLGVLVSADKDLDDNDSTKLIHVTNQHAIVLNDICAVVNLREYLKHECNIDSEDDISTMDEILEWMEGKTFTKEYWDELKKPAIVRLITDGLELEHLSYSKQLIWENVYPNNEGVFDVVQRALLKAPNTVSTVAFKGDNLSSLHKAFGTEVKSDSWILDFSGNDNHMRFSAKSKSYIFGFLPLIPDDANELTAFLDAKTFGKYLKDII